MKIFNLTLYVMHSVIFPAQLSLGIFFLRIFGNRSRAARLQALLNACPEGSVGYAVRQMLQETGHRFVPGYEHHDLKHVVLGYPMRAPDEIRMQAFMFGNAGFNFFSVFTFLIFVVWTPDAWKDLYFHYQIGRRTKPIHKYPLSDVLMMDLHAFRAELGIEAARASALAARQMLQKVW